MHVTESPEVKGSNPIRAIALNNYINGQVLYDSLYAKADRVSFQILYFRNMLNENEVFQHDQLKMTN